MPTPKSTAEAFRQLDFHDETVVGMKVLPSQQRGAATSSIVEIQLHQYCANALRLIRFSGCANLRVAMDFDVLAGNLPPNMRGVDAHTNLNRMRDLMQSQKKDWGVEYAATAISPLADKLAALDELVSFRVQFFGGAVDIIARDYVVETANEAFQVAAAPAAVPELGCSTPEMIQLEDRQSGKDHTK
jgi:hypothetical protein